MAPENVLAALMQLAAEAASRRRRKGDRVPASQVARVVATKKRMARDKRKAAWQRRLKARPRGVKKWAPIGERVTDRLLAVMRPGEWYGQRDIVRAAGYPRGYNSKVLQVLLPASLIERKRNPAYRGHAKQREVFTGLAEPVWLYRLTRRGELERASVLLVGVVPYAPASA